MTNNVLIIGSGGREHALAWKLSQSPLCQNLYIAPGNAGTSDYGQNIDLNILDFDQIKKIVHDNKIDYIIVGPEAPLVEGIYDAFLEHEVKIFGPSKEASRLEGSKSYANDFMKEFGIPTADYMIITKDNLQDGIDHIEQQKSKIVLKADGLAAGKGVLILNDKEEAKKELASMIEGKFGQASERVVIEEFLDGIEFSVFVITDGKEYKLLPVAKDYKRRLEGDQGLNTGGMGAVSPVPFVDEVLMDKVKSEIIIPTINGLKKKKLEYKGVIFFGLINVEGDPYVIEYNCRFGDPETEVILPRIESDLFEHIISVFGGTLGNQTIKFRPESAATIFLVSDGYPGAYQKGKHITIDKSQSESLIFHAGTKTLEHDVVTNGGRVIAITSYGGDHKEAISKSLQNISSVHFEGMQYRKDIGFDL